MPTLILHPRYDEDSQLVWQAATDRGWKCVRIGWDFRHGAESIPDDDEPLVFYGGWEWAGAAAKAIPPFHVPISPPDDHVVDLPYALTKRWIRIEQTRDAAGFPFPVFVKALTGKPMTARVYHSLADLPPNFDDVGRVIIQEPVAWLEEFRTFMLHGDPQAISRYATRGALDARQVSPSFGEQLKEVTSMIDDDRPIVVDFGWIEGRGWAIVETNPAWCSGIYGCDPSEALRVIAASCGVCDDVPKLITGDVTEG